MMKQLGMRRVVRYGGAAALLVAVGLATALAAATAQAAPSKKNFTVQVAVTKPASGLVNPQNFTVKLTNDGSSNTTLGSANVSTPASFVVGTAVTTQLGWTATPAGSGFQLRSAAASYAL